MARTNIKKGPSVEELKALQEKAQRGETLTAAEQELIIAAEVEAEEAAEQAKQDELTERIANLVAKKIQSGAIADGGKPFVPPTEEEIAKMKKQTPKERADEYYNNTDLKNFPWPGIHVTDDLQIFMGHVQGENARDNHIAANPGMKFESFKKPGTEE